MIRLYGPSSWGLASRLGCVGIAGVLLVVAAPRAHAGTGSWASGTIELVGRQLLIRATAHDDVAEISDVAGGAIRVLLSGGGLARDEHFAAADVQEIVFDGGPGDDRVRNDTAIRLIAIGGDGDDALTGGAGGDLLLGGPGDDRLAGRNGDDFLLGDEGRDELSGGAGDDQIIGGDGADTVRGGDGADAILGGKGDDVMDGEAGADVVVGDAGADVVRGGAGDDYLEGGDAADEIDGGDGADTLIGGAGDDTLRGDAGPDELRGDSGDDVLDGGPGDDVLVGGGGNDILAGHDGDDDLLGGKGDDGLDGGFGDDWLLGEDGNDTLVGRTGSDVLLGDAGDDFLMGGFDADVLHGDAGDDTLRGDAQDAVLDGGPGRNTVSTARRNRFGIVANAANAENASVEDAVDALEKAITVAGQISVFWSFRDQDDLEAKLQLVSAIADLGASSFVQIDVHRFGVPNLPAGLGLSFGDPAVRAQFLENVSRVAELEPAVINLALEVNLLYWIEPTEYALFATLYREAYVAVKSISPQTRVGVSFLYSLFQAFEQFEALTQLGPHDYVAFTTYPIWQLGPKPTGALDEFSPEYWTWMREVYPHEKIIISEIGFPNSAVSTPREQAEFVRRLPELLAGVRAESVNWILLTNTSFFNRGMLDESAARFLEEQGVNPDLLFHQLNNMGLHALDGTPLPAWFEALKLTF